MEAEAQRLAEQYAIEHDIAYLEVPSGAARFDKTELLLLGQQKATVAVVLDASCSSSAAGCPRA